MGEPGLGRWTWRELAKLYETFPEALKQKAQLKRVAYRVLASIRRTWNTLLRDLSEQHTQHAQSPTQGRGMAKRDTRAQWPGHAGFTTTHS